jgi:indoleamine 2,3-dioxygenase
MNHGHDAGCIIIQKVANSGRLISAAEDCITAAANDRRDEFNTALEQLYNAYQSINQSMETMWGRSKPADYIKFRCVGLRYRESTQLDYRPQVLYLRYCPKGGD